MSFQFQKNELIAITGSGSVSPLGYDNDLIYSKYLTKDTCIVNKPFNNKIYPVAPISKQAEEQLIKLILENPKCKRIDKTVLMAMKAAKIAFDQSGWSASSARTTGINFGSSRGSTALFEELHEEFLRDRNKKTAISTSPLTTLGYVSNNVASYLNTSGPVINTSITCSTGIQAICNAIAWIRSGMANRFIVGGTEAPITKFTIAQVEALGIYSKLLNEKYPCAPLFIERKGVNTFVLGEGAAALAIEKLNILEVKQRKPLAIIESVGFSYEKPPSLTGLSEDGSLIASSMKMATQQMLTDNNVDLIMLHCPGTVKGDEAELNAVHNVFCNDIPNLFSNKWKIGHSYAASPALSVALGIMCIQNNYSPSFPYATEIKNRQRNIRKVMINATGFGGNATSVIISHPDLFS
ncbi:MAG TPA: beta-ketoacyl synthase N-terminal-like domain-containing protein [Bacteroidales bacterium]|nr:beta-ketoacyl synthase N-terminal-like domain-containing protein [Bacteroidales bacterium]HPS16979.1 beta-ketoacyl synthase N-terminal-like domain-containing protein [Bacteroidales bacterium]